MKRLKATSQMKKISAEEIARQEKMQAEKFMRTNAMTLKLRLENGHSKLFSKSVIRFAWTLRRFLASELGCGVMAISWKSVISMVKNGESTVDSYTNRWEA